MSVRQEKVIDVGLVQVACSTIDGSLFLPYSIGLLQAFFIKHSFQARRFNFIQPIVTERSISKAVQILSKAKIIAFSTYVWNGNISLRIAESAKQNNPDVIIIFGGPYVPLNASEFLLKYPFVDLIIHGEGEIGFLKFLENFHLNDWSVIPGARFIDNSGNYREGLAYEKVTDLNAIPSPYLAGIFDHLFESTTVNNWVGVWETNRGCPYHCSFCEWGTTLYSKLRKYDIDRLHSEINWFATHRIKLLCCCDANFGMFERDKNLAEYIAGIKLRTGFPLLISVQNAKNSTRRNYDIHKCFVESGLATTIGLSFQSLDYDTLQNIRRDNIDVDSFKTLQKLFNSLGVSTYSELILGLPGETYNSYVEGICKLIENGQHNSIRANNLTVLPNSEMSSEDYRNLHRLETVSSFLVNPGQQPLTGYDDTYEIQEMVCSTATMPRQDWVSSRVFSWLLSLMYFEKLLWLPMFVYYQNYGISFRRMIEIVIGANGNFPTLMEVSDILKKHALRIQQGEPEYLYSEEWLGVFWPVGKYVYLKLLFEGKLDRFYEEFKIAMNIHEGVRFDDNSADIINQSFILNRDMLKSQNHASDYSKTVFVNYNYLECFDKIRKGFYTSLEKIEIRTTAVSINIQKRIIPFLFDNWLREILSEGFIYKVQAK